MNEATTIEILLYCMIGMIGFFGVIVTYKLGKLTTDIHSIASAHGQRLVRLETKAEMIAREVQEF